MTNKVICTRDIKTKKGLEFKKGDSYDYTISDGRISIFATKSKSIKIREKRIFDKYFK